MLLIYNTIKNLLRLSINYRLHCLYCNNSTNLQQKDDSLPLLVRWLLRQQTQQLLLKVYTNWTIYSMHIHVYADHSHCSRQYCKHKKLLYSIFVYMYTHRISQPSTNMFFVIQKIQDWNIEHNRLVFHIPILTAVYHIMYQEYRVNTG